MTTLRKGTALVVDDEEDIRTLISAALTDAGCRVLAAGDADTALDILDRAGSTSRSSTSTSAARTASTSSTPCASAAAPPTWS